MSNVAPFPTPQSASDDLADARIEHTLALVKILIESLPPQTKEQLLREVAEGLRPSIAPHAGKVLGTIVRLLSKRSDFTVAELKQQIHEQGLTVSPKAIYNAIGYLTRKRHIRRLGYGRYLVDGIPVMTADDLGGERSITEGDLDD
jgi:hypothetical protein